MEARFRQYDGTRILEITLSSGDISTDERNAMSSWKELSDLIEASIRREGPAVPLVAVNLLESAPSPEQFETWSRNGAWWKGDRAFSFVHSRAGSLVFFGVKPGPWRGKAPVYESENEAFEGLRAHEKSVRQEREAANSTAFDRLGTPRLCLVGCHSRDLSTLPRDFNNLGIEIVSPKALQPCELVLFCVSVADGPTEGTRLSISSLSGKEITPLAVVLVHSAVINDDSMRSLINMEERDLLSAVLPKECVDNLPVLLDCDPTLISKVASIARQGPDSFCCRSG